MLKTTRREALVTIAGGISARSLHSQGAYEPRTFSQEEYESMGTRVDMILPPSDTPGAREVGVHAMLDEDLANDASALGILRGGLASLRNEGFGDMDPAQRVQALTRYSESDGERKEFFETLKGLTIDAYYSTEVGLVDELGYQGNTYLTEFPGCTHEHHLEEAD